ncbi:hypothetical protein HOY82DRAFT_613728 [Tuber indicum]|nr:hypothetical protein HOY82DRAFT_613728 [Tuber indicum]
MSHMDANIYFTTRYERPGYLQRLREVSFKNHEDCEYSYVAFYRGVDYHTNVKNNISPTIDDFCITPDVGEPNTPVESPYTASQLQNYTLTLLRIILPPIKRDGNVILDVCTPIGSNEPWVVPENLGKPERPNIKICDGNKRLMSKLIGTMDPHSNGVRAVIKDKNHLPEGSEDGNERVEEGFKASGEAGGKSEAG